MAGDWIKMRIDLQTHPKVVRILSALNRTSVQITTDKFRVIGGLHAVWSVFDTHSHDGELVGYTPETLDHIIGWEGFTPALISVGWLVENPGVSLIMPEFVEHNGQSGKRRAEDQKRKRESRKCPQSVRNLSANEQDKKRTREEKRREEKKNDCMQGPADCLHLLREIGIENPEEHLRAALDRGKTDSDVRDLVAEYDRRQSQPSPPRPPLLACWLKGTKDWPSINQPPKTPSIKVPMAPAAPPVPSRPRLSTKEMLDRAGVPEDADFSKVGDD